MTTVTDIWRGVLIMPTDFVAVFSGKRHQHHRNRDLRLSLRPTYDQSRYACVVGCGPKLFKSINRTDRALGSLRKT